VHAKPEFEADRDRVDRLRSGTAQAQHPHGPHADIRHSGYQSHVPCPHCHATDAQLITKGHQATVRCARCDRFLYNAPRVETGAKRRSVKTLRRSIRPAQQARILDRDHCRCVLCGTHDDLTIGHLLSLEDGARLGAGTVELYSDANLAAMCEACNAGLRHGPRSINVRTYLTIVWRLVQTQTVPHSAQTSLNLDDASHHTRPR
jgi:5-methylcytosine-specific restriction endonuclease McrA